MAVPVFGVTADIVRRHHFPTISAFSSSTRPTDTTVTDAIADVAGEVCAVLLQKNINPTTLSADAGATYPIAYQRCQRFIRIGAAIQTKDAAEQKDDPIIRRWVSQFSAFMRDVKESGYLALGDAPAPAQSAVGPRDFVSELGLDTGNTADISDAIPPFRKNDEV